MTEEHRAHQNLEHLSREELIAEVLRLQRISEPFLSHLPSGEMTEISFGNLLGIIDQSPASIVITDVNGTIEYVNPKFTEISGYTLLEAVGRNPRMLKSGHTSSDAYKDLWDTITSGNVWRGEFRNRKKSGEEYWELASIAPIKSSAGVVTRFVGIKEDITDRKMAEQALIDSETKYRHLVENLDEGIWVIDQHSVTTFVNVRLAEILGYSIKEMIGRSLFEFIEKDALKRTADAVERRKTGKKEQSESVILTKNKTPITISVVTYPTFGADGGYTGAVAAVTDITDRKRASEAIEASRDQLRQLAIRVEQVREEERTSIAREIHDELGQNLTGLKMNLSWLAKKLLDQKNLHDKVVHMNDLVDVTIDEVRRIATELRPGMLDELGLGAAMVWHGKNFERESGIDCRVEIGESVQNISRKCSTAMFRIFQEALTNIARHAKASLVVTVLTIEGDILKMELTDNGIGFNDASVNDTKSIGLLGMKERALALNGSLLISSGKGSGTKITTMIPLRVQ
ncbi:MAG: PAS domain S-box protein [Bacteroidetes bacterium]|nr:PAS domain S-box protein [Bacteroidota bacterium]